jgi:hypothetical protein
VAAAADGVALPVTGKRIGWVRRMHYIA